MLKAYISIVLMLSLSTNTKLVAFYAPTTMHTIPPSKSTMHYFWLINPPLKLGCHPSPTTSLTSSHIYQQNNPTFTTSTLNTHTHDAKQNTTPPSNHHLYNQYIYRTSLITCPYIPSFSHTISTLTNTTSSILYISQALSQNNTQNILPIQCQYTRPPP